jgi:SAM-dependent methyltransferase
MTLTLEERLRLLEERQALLTAYSVEAVWRAIDRAEEAGLEHREFTCIVCAQRGSRRAYKVLSSRCQFGGGRLERYQCPGCDAVFGPQKYLDLSQQMVDRDYELLYASYSEGDSTEKEIKTFHSMHPSNGALYLDWGCGAKSRVVSSLRARGFDVWGYEPTAARTEDFIVKSRLEISARFDGIFSNNVIEHFRDPVAQFQDFKSILKPGGRMAHSTPCYEYACEDTRFHTLFLLGRSPFVLAERTGFRAREAERSGGYINFLFDSI